VPRITFGRRLQVLDEQRWLPGIRHSSSAVTISNNHTNGANAYVCDGQHNFISLVSASQATVRHNYFNHVGARNPMVTDSAKVHLYNTVLGLTETVR
jgi:pectate lyase